MNTYVNPASNISYTAKDYQTIFPDIVSLAKDLSSRWDPTISTESDPGVVLLKINAILGDKLNYNIDKNILEAFPLSLTLMSSAKKIYSLLGYKMHWYNSATCKVALAWTGELSENNSTSLTIPMFTTITDDNNSLLYTLICTDDPSVDDSVLVPNDIILNYKNSNSEGLFARAIQGRPVKYDINGELVVHIGNLDGNNRIYFSTTDIPENGIFIKNTNTNTYDWKRVDNLFTETLGNKYFEFGITDDLYSCYIEFPEDAEDLIRDGIEIMYISTDGYQGNINISTLTKFSSDLFLINSNDETISSSGNIEIINITEGTGGLDPETLEEAYNNYKKVVGTFDTLVTLRDYMNAIMLTGLVSNCFVCDNTNDIQCSYTVKAIINGIETDLQLIEMLDQSSSGAILTGDIQGYYKNNNFYTSEDRLIEKQEGKFYKDLLSNSLYYCNGSTYISIKNDVSHNTNSVEPAIGPVSIKLYVLEKVDTPNTLNKVSQTFDLLGNDELDVVKLAIEKNKHIGLDYVNILPTTNTYSRPCMFKNKYTINARIYPTILITDTIKKEIRESIMQSFYSNLNASKVSFGEGVQLDKITSIIENADDRIKTAYIDTLNYDTYAVYYIEQLFGEDIIGEFKEVKISGTDTIDSNSLYSSNNFEYRRIYRKGDLICLPIANSTEKVRYRCLRNNVDEFVLTAWERDEYSFDIDYDTFVTALVDDLHKLGSLNYGKVISFYTDESCKHWCIKKSDGTYLPINLSDYGITQTGGTLYYNTSTNTPDIILFLISKATLIRDEVFAKSILSGKTPLLIESETAMDYNFLNSYVSTKANVAEIEGNVNIEFKKDNDYQYLLRQNELILFFAPMYDWVADYSNYVKIEYHFEVTPERLLKEKNIPANCNYKLRSKEYIAFYYLTSTDQTNVYDYHAYGPGTVINSNFSIPLADSTYKYLDLIVSLPQGDEEIQTPGWKKTGVGGSVYLETYSAYNGPMQSSVSDKIKIIGTDSSLLVLNGNKKITINAIAKDTADNLCYCYWILNSTFADSEDSMFRYILFEKGLTERLLGNNEYFMYTDPSSAELLIYGQGTKISRPNNDRAKNESVSVVANVDYLDLFDSGSIQTSGKFYTPPIGSELVITKNESVYLGEGCLILLDFNAASNMPNILTITNNGVIVLPEGSLTLRDCAQIKYNKPGESDYPNSLTKINDSSIGWDALSMLQLKFNSKDGLILNKNLFITIYGDTWSHVEEKEGQLIIVGTTIEGQDFETKEFYNNTFTIPEISSEKIKTEGYIYGYYPCVLFADNEVNITTAGRTDIVKYSIDGSIVYTNISIGENNSASSPSIFNPTTTGALILTIRTQELTDSSGNPYYANASMCPIKFAPGDYITLLTSSSKEVSNLLIYLLSSEEIRLKATGETSYKLPTSSSYPEKVNLIFYIKDDLENIYPINYYEGQQIYIECKLNRAEISDNWVYPNDHMLLAGEYIVFYKKDISSGNYIYLAYGEGTMVDNSFLIVASKIGHSVADNIDILKSANIGTLTDPKNWSIEILQRHYVVLAEGLTSSTVTAIVESTIALKNDNKLLDRYIEVGFPTDLTAEIPVFIPGIDYTYNSTNHTITFKSGSKPTAEGNIICVTSNLEVAKPGKEDRNTTQVTTIYGQTDLHNCDRTPVVFTIPDKYDPATYKLPLYLTAIQKLNSSKLHSNELITITNPEKYIYNNKIDGKKIDKYDELVKQLDVDHVFNYAYTPTEEELIDDPLNPLSFLNSSHPYNRYTICLYDGIITDLEVVQKE